MNNNFYELGGSGPVRLTGTAPITGDFFCIEANGAAPLVIAQMLGLQGVWTNITLAPSANFLTGNKTVTSITLTSGSGWAYQR